MKGKFTVLLIIGLLFGCTLAGYAQNKTITGVVTDAQTGDPLPGVNILVVGTSTGAATDAKGHYSLSVPNLQDTLRFSFIGYQAKTVSINGRTKIDVQLKPTIISGNQLVVVGFGTQKKGDLSSSIATANVQQLQKTAVLPSSAAALEGTMAGVSVTASNGSPGAEPNIHVRGVSSFGNTQPLVIINGVQGKLSDVSPEDIRSLQVLKDAAAAAIYGSRAANGVILVKTKNGSSGKIKVDVKTTYSIQQPTHMIPLANLRQYAKIDNELHQNSGVPVFSALKNPESLEAGTNWQNVIYNSAPILKTYMSVSGGSENSTYRISGSFNKRNGIMKHTWFKKGNLRYNGQQNTDHFTFGESFNWNERNRRTMPGGGDKPLTQEILLAQPNMPVFDSNNLGGFGGVPGYIATQAYNPLGLLALQNNTNHNNSVHMDVFARYQFLHHFSVKINAGYGVLNAYAHSHNSQYFFSNQRQLIRASLSETRGRTHHWLLDNTLKYKQQFGKNSISALADFTTQENHFRQTVGSKSGFPNNQLDVLNASTGFSINSAGEDYRWDLVSWLGRILYNYNEEFYLTANIRRDGSSRFGLTNRYGTFPSASVAWRISKAGFFDPLRSVITNLKLRASYGVLGNQPSQPTGEPDDEYTYIPTISIGPSLGYLFGGALATGATQESFVNPNVKWETTKDLDIGANVGIVNNISIAFDYFSDRTSGLLLNVPIPPSTGTTTAPLVNTGKVRNEGVEFSIKYNAPTTDVFHYTISGNISTVRNKVEELGFAGQVIRGTAPHRAATGPITEARKGFPIGAFFMLQADGLFQNQQEINNYTKNGKLIQPNAKPGDVRYIDENNDGKIGPEDAIYSGSAIPKFSYGLNFSANYKNLDFALFIQGTYGNKMFDTNTWITMRAATDYNFNRALLNAWTPNNTDTNVPRLDFNGTNNRKPSTRFLYNASYLRIKNIQVGYNIPEQLLASSGISGIRVFISGYNLWTITPYPGYDPSYTGNGLLDRGLDQGLYPQSRIFSGGIDIKF
jgi:TonB-linked SusC/RagA family outer membrane protein